MEAAGDGNRSPLRVGQYDGEKDERGNGERMRRSSEMRRKVREVGEEQLDQRRSRNLSQQIHFRLTIDQNLSDPRKAYVI